jgi:very-short-patch-repair endonuclease
MAAGWRVLRFTWNDIRHAPDVVVAELLAALSAGSHVRVAG